jgi:hypothetical protein
MLSVEKKALFQDVFTRPGWWLTPVILATQEAEIRKMAIRGRPKQQVHETTPPISTNGRM